MVGFNHHFGFNKEGDYRQLWSWQEKYNFEAEEIPEQEVYNETVSSTKIRQAISEGYIQRANAYLDHYYIIMGITEPFISEANPALNSFVRIKITEECKIIPSPGIYAVSVEQKDSYSKGMVLIGKDLSDQNNMLLDIFDNNIIDRESRLSISFHKKTHGFLNLTDSNSSQKIKSSKEEISDLIY